VSFVHFGFVAFWAGWGLVTLTFISIRLASIGVQLRRIADAAERRADNSWENQWRD
jgi:hypothetical protein